ncbi:LITAF-like zinc ribbon domain-containing protein [Mollicutes bacterium LVI A0078]|nr:LITAF-like zinc ribbon domain-containing protein [Mollicutes bacterium LVI A0075]WOO90239.1 LITAF-like zinc ribbon domain-containing protein [Mollicutes bacterium LVI A0078]
MRCPRCGSENTTVLQQEHRKGFGFCPGILGVIIFGLPGLLCGLCGMGETKGHSAYIVCGNCGAKTRI